MPGQPDNQDAQASFRAIEQGGLPPAAVARLKENADRQRTSSHLFTSDLSVNELLLTKECGYEPLAQVMGTSVYHVGWTFYPGQTWGSVNPISGLPYSQELDVLTQAHYDARRLTFSRLVQEAMLVHADGVVGVRFERIQGNLPSDTFEFKAVGTAVRLIGAPPAVGLSPFVSNLSGQDHWALRKAGMKPIGFAFGNCSWYQVASWQTQNIEMAGFFSQNQEYRDFTQGVYQARELAMERLEQDAVRLGAAGVVGVTIEPSIQMIELPGNNPRRDLLVQFTVFGTAVGWEQGATPARSTQQVISLGNS